MAEPISIQQLKDASLDVKSLEEVVNGDENVVVTTRLGETYPSIKSVLENTISKFGYVTIDSFELGATITQRNQALRHAADGKLYRWAGDLPKVVPASSTPVNSGGFGANAWLEVSDTTLRQDIVTGGLVTDVLTTTVPIEGTLGESRSQLEKNRESISVFDFFTHAELAEYEANSYLNTSLFDAYRPLQEFFDYTADSNVGTAYCNGNFSTTKGIIMGGSTGRSLTKLIIGNFRLVAINDINNIIDDLLHISMGENFTWSGSIEVLGSGVLAIEYAKRKVRNGIRFGGVRGTSLASTHNNFGIIDAANGFLNWGVILDNLTTGTVVDKIRVNRSGCGYNDPNSTKVTSLFSDFEVVSQTEGTTSQRTTLKLSNPQDFSKLDGICYVEINKQLYYAYVGDITAEKSDELTVFPKLPSDVTAGNLKFIFGGGFLTRGGDSSVPTINATNITTCSIALSLESLYPPIFGAITTQTNCVVLSIGSGLSSGIVGGYASEIYFEAQDYSIVQNTKYTHNFKIGNTVNFNINRTVCLANHRLADDTMASSWGYSGQIGIRHNKVTPINHLVATTRTLDLGDYESSPITHIVASSNKTITLALGTKTSVRDLMLFGQVTKTLYAYTPIGGKHSITVIPPADVQVNGSTSPISLDNYIGVVRLDFHLFSSTQVVMQVTGNKEVVTP